MGEWFYTITQSMLELGLRGTDLLVYAVVATFSQRGEGCYYGSRADLCRRCGVDSARTIDKALQKLVEEGFISKTPVIKDNVLYNAYSLPVQNLQGGAEFAQGGVHNLHGGCATFAHNNKINNKDTNVSSLSTAHARGSKAFVAPSVEEVAAYCRERGNAVDAQTFVDFYKAKGWKIGNAPMRDWQAAVRTWERRPSHTPTPELRRTPSPAQRKFDSMIQAGIELGIIKPQTTEYDEQ